VRSAGRDEDHHAKVSFEVASLLRSAMGEGPVQPGPLPPSTHPFESDMTALISGAAKEGCIDETLSALAAAAEADFTARRQIMEIALWALFRLVFKRK
jgi:hypothetical protein